MNLVFDLVNYKRLEVSGSISVEGYAGRGGASPVLTGWSLEKKYHIPCVATVCLVL